MQPTYPILYIPLSHTHVFPCSCDSYGDYLIVGIHNDNVVNRRHGMNLPIMNLQERVLSVLGCKYVDDVLIDAPYIITQEMITFLRIHTVIYPKHHPLADSVLSDTPHLHPHYIYGEEGSEPSCPAAYELPLRLGILKKIYISYNLSGK